jgi:Holliday junction resolvase
MVKARGGAANRRAGDYFERRCRDTLEYRGYVVIRAAGSRGPADLVALKSESSPLLIQCKINGHISRAEIRATVAMASQAGALPLLAHRARPGAARLSLLAVHSPSVTIWADLTFPPSSHD